MLAQIPELDKSNEVRAEVIKGGFVWGVKFKLPMPAEQDGHIIQMIRQNQRGTISELAKSADGTQKVVERSSNMETVYWEAWEVKKGETTPRLQQSIASFVMEKTGSSLSSGKYQIPVNDIFFKGYAAGSVGTYNIKSLAGFYHDTLTSDFTVGNLQTGAGGLRSTTVEPKFWTVRAGLHRDLTFTFDFLNNLTMMGNIRPNPPKAEKYDHRETLAAWGF